MQFILYSGMFIVLNRTISLPFLCPTLKPGPRCGHVPVILSYTQYVSIQSI